MNGDGDDNYFGASLVANRNGDIYGGAPGIGLNLDESAGYVSGFRNLFVSGQDCIAAYRPATLFGDVNRTARVGASVAAKQMKHANFPLLVTNYNFANTAMQGKTQNYRIFRKGGVRIGVYGVGIELKGLVPDKLYGDTQYSDPVAAAQKWGEILRHEEKCDYIICLSHLGCKYNEDKVSDRVLAQNTSNIDLIIGGHTHTFMKEPERLVNKDGKPVLIIQVGWAGIVLGRLDVYFEKNKKGTCITCKNLTV